MARRKRSVPAALPPEGGLGHSRLPDITPHGFLREKLRQAALGLLYRKDIKGPMGSFLYAAPLSDVDPVRGSECWKRAAENPVYRLLRDEENVLKNPDILDRLKRRLPYGVTIIDSACGDARKLEPVLRSLHGVSQYIAVDQTQVFAQKTAEAVHETFPDIQTSHMVRDIINGGPPEVRGEIFNPVMILVGGLLTNGSWSASRTQSDDQKLASVIKEIARVFSNQNKYFQNSGHILSTWQVCDTEHPEDFRVSIEESYNINPAFHDFVLNGLHLIASDLSVEGFDPNSFDYEGRWIPNQMRMEFNAVAQKAQTFLLEGQRCYVSKGERVCILNSFKFEPGVLDVVFNVAGFGQVEQMSIPGNQISLVITEAPPAQDPASVVRVRRAYPRLPESETPLAPAQALLNSLLVPQPELRCV